MKKIKFDFSGYATKNDIKCSDGRVIKHNAFKDNDGGTVPLVWQHMHGEVTNVLGHAVLENREDGVYAYCKFNGTDKAQHAREMVESGDVSHLSIFANQLKQKGSNVVHGVIRELSLVLSGANPGARIDNINIAHGDVYETSDDEAVITFASDDFEEIDVDVEIELEHSEGEEKTIADIVETMNDEQKEALYAMLAQVAGGEESDEDLKQSDQDDDNLEHSEDGGEEMKKNAFEKKTGEENTIKHVDIDAKEFIHAAVGMGSMRDYVNTLVHEGTYGINDIDFLFPDPKKLQNAPDFISRRMEWVAGVIGGVHKSPFSRIKTVHADITEDEARAKGYVKGNQKIEEVFGLLKRVTTPQTVYKKQKLDRDDIIDITDFDVVSWLKAEMRVMLDEELARAILVGDGRSVASDDKIKEEHIRPIWKDDALYSHKIKLAATVTTIEKIEAIIRARKQYKGSGNPVLYTTADELTDMLLVKDANDHYLYKTEAELMARLRVSKIVEVEVMEGLERNDGTNDVVLNAILVNLRDYNLGADKGGKVSMFDDFDIDVNQLKYLIETRCSGALTKPKSAIVIETIKTVG